MRRNITLLMSAILLFFMGVITAQAQSSVEELGTPLITDASQLSSNASDSEEGKHIEYLVDGDASTFWHSDWHGVCQDPYHYIQVELAEEFTGDIVIDMTRRSSAYNDHPIEMLVQGSLNGQTFTDIATVAISNGEAGLHGTSDAFTVSTPVKYLRLNVTNCQDNGYGFRKYWHCAELQLYGLSHEDALKIRLNNVLLKYDGYLYGDTFDVGTNYGQYDAADLVLQFMEKITYANQIIEEQVERPSDEVIEALVVEIDELYNKILATEVLYKLPADGYYRIYSNLHYYVENGTGQYEVDENGDSLEIKTKEYVTKALYGTLDGYCKWGTYAADDCRFIWKLTQQGNSVDMMNAGTDMRFAHPFTGKEMSTDGTVMAAFDYAGTETSTFDGVEKERTIVYIRPDSLARNAGSSNYLHQWYHGSGTGTGHELCLWQGTFDKGEEYTTDKGTSEWFLEPVSEEEAQKLIEAFEPYKNHDKLVLKFRELISQCQSSLSVAEDKGALYSPDLEKGGIITETSQFSSTCSEPSEGSLDNLLDDNSSTFWHSAWSSGSVANHTHSIDISFPEALAPGAYQAWVQRRGSASDNDNPILFSVYGSNDPAALTTSSETGWTLIASGLNDPWTSGVVVTWMDAFVLTTPYKYLRFYNDGTRGPSTSCYDRGYWHMGGFQLYHATKTGVSQLENMGQVGTDFVAALGKATSLADADINVDEYEALEKAYEAFTKMLVDPTPMRNLVSQYKDYPSLVEVGENPGFWKDDTEAKALTAIMEEATQYGNVGKFDKATLDSYVEKIEAAKDAFFAAANKVQTDQWYKFHFPTQDIYDKYGKSNSGATGSSLGDALGRYVTVGTYQAANEAEGLELAILQTPDGEAREGAALWLVDEPQYEDMATFRFVVVGDSAYAIQNKATGLFIHIKAANNNDVTLSLTPSLFDLSPVGGGLNLMHGRTLAGEERTYLHLQNSNQRLVSWEAYTLGSNSCWLIEAAGEVESDYEPMVQKDLVEGKFYPMCYPVALTPAEGALYTVEGTYTKDDKNYLAMNETESVEAGQPVVFLLGDPEGYAAPAEGESEETIEVSFRVDASAISAQPKTVGGFTGVFDQTKMDAGTIVFDANTVVVAESASNVAANTGYILWGAANADAEGEYGLVMEINGAPTSIKAVTDKVAQTDSDIYTLSGSRVSKAVKGVYIIGRKKLYVK